MQKLAEICIRRPVFASMLILSLVVVGAFAYFRLGVDRFPAVDLPSVSIRTELPGAAPEEVEVEINEPIEEVVNTVEGIVELRSIAGQSTSIVLVTFDLDRDIDVATQDIRDRIATVIRRLPRDIEPPIVSKFNQDGSPVLSLALSGDRTIRELTELADKIVKVNLERSEGVGEVAIVGGLERSINVWVDPDRLAAYGLPITAVSAAIVSENADVPGGNVTEARREQSLRTMGRVTDPRAFGDILVAIVNGEPVRLRDVSYTEDGTKEPRSLARLNGTPTVSLDVRRQSGANSVAVIEGVKEKLERVRELLPADVSLEIIRDQSRYIEEALAQINEHLVLGSVLACLVVLLFMRSWRSTFIASIAIPTSVIATFGVMAALGFTLNSVTMLALVLMVGIIIDDAIVVLENIFRFIEEKGMRPFDAAKVATADIGLAVMATTFSLVVIFIPVSFMSSVSGRFLYQFGITAAVSVLVSLLVSFTLTPMMSARLLRSEGSLGHSTAHGAAKSRRGFYAVLDRGYERLLAFSLRHRIAVSVLALLVMASAVPLYGVVRQDYLPTDVDEAEFDVNVTAPEGTSFDAMQEVMLEVEKELRSTPGVVTTLVSGGGSFIGGVNRGDAYVRIEPHANRVFSISRFFTCLFEGDPGAAFRGNYTQRDVMTAVRRKLSKFADLRCSVRNAPSFNIGGGNFEIDFALRGPDLEALARYADELRARSRELGGIVDADTTLKLDKPELRVAVDRERAADLGVSVRDIASALRLMVGGDQRVSRWRDPALGEEYDVQVRLEEGARNDAATISRLMVPRRDGTLVRLDNLVRIEAGDTSSRIDRLDRQRQVSLRASVGPGFALADRLEALRGAVDEMDLPAAYSTAVSGRGRELERTFDEFVWAFALSIAFMYMILAAQFESVTHPLTILLSLPLSMPFALLSLHLTGNSLNLYSALGILVLFGVVKKNSILQIDQINRLREDGMHRERAILEGNRNRLRPILMTTLALVAGMLPLAVGTGPGAEERRSVAVVVIGGQMLALLLTLVVTPVAYSLFDDAGRLFRSRAARREEEGEPGATLPEAAVTR